MDHSYGGSEGPRDWSHQQRAAELATAAIVGGSQSVVVCSPTGSGKTYIQSGLAKRCAQSKHRAILLTNRRILLKQAADQLAKDDIDFGVISADWGEYFDPLAPVQLCSIPTLWARKDRIQLPPADMVIIDEAHSNCKGEMARGLIEHYRQQGAAIVGFTATPVGLGEVYEKLVIAARNSELIAKQILVPCETWAPNEPNMDGVKIVNGEYASEESAKRVRQCTVFGHVFPHWDKINPDRKPTIMWAPGIEFSRWFVQEFNAVGVTSAHIDGHTPDSERDDIFGRFREGKLTLISSAGVLREGVDLKEAEVGILLQPCKQISTYIQIAGRLLRSSPETGKKQATLIDHAGAVWLHGSPTQDVDWRLDDTASSASQRAKKQRKEKGESEGICCRQCHHVRPSGAVCPNCGLKAGESCRFVREIDGTLTKRVSAQVSPEVALKTELQRKWDSCFWACRNSKRRLTFKQAAAMYKNKNGAWPPSDLLRMPPPGSPEWSRPIREVLSEWKRKSSLDAGESRSKI